MIIGTDLMSELGLKLNFQDACVEWEDAMPFKDRDATFETAFHVEDIRSVQKNYGSYKVDPRCYLRKDISRKDNC